MKQMINDDCQLMIEKNESNHQLACDLAKLQVTQIEVYEDSRPLLKANGGTVIPFSAAYRQPLPPAVRQGRAARVEVW